MGKKKVIVDLGSGPVAWEASKIAKRNPDALVIAVDSKEMRKEAFHPENLRMVQADFYDPKFKLPVKADKITIHFLSAQVPPFPEGITKLLKKDGVIEIKLDPALKGIVGGKLGKSAYEKRVNEIVNKMEKEGLRVVIRTNFYPPTATPEKKSRTLSLTEKAIITTRAPVEIDTVIGRRGKSILKRKKGRKH